MPTNTSSTPQTSRQLDASGSVLLRRSFESELWDDLSNVVFDKFQNQLVTITNNSTFNTPTANLLTVPCPLACRYEVTIEARFSYTSTGGQRIDMQPFFDSVAQGSVATWQSLAPAASSTQIMTLVRSTIFDVTPGIHTLGVHVIVGTGGADVTMDQQEFMVRRGRQPVG